MTRPRSASRPATLRPSCAPYTTTPTSASGSWRTSAASTPARRCRSSTTCGRTRRRTGCVSSPRTSTATIRACPRSPSCGRAPSGASARPMTCAASSSRATATFVASTCRPTTPASRCARTSCCPTTRHARRVWAFATWSRRAGRPTPPPPRRPAQGEGGLTVSTTPEARVRSLDGPELYVETPATIFDAIPPYPPRTEREAEFYSVREGEMLINLGPQHPSTHGVLRVVLKIDGERVVDLDPVLGYLHRGVEKICENSDWHMVVSHCAPLEYIARMFSELVPVMAAEKLLDVEVPRRAEYIRVLACELNRISSHALFMGWLALDPGGPAPILYGCTAGGEVVRAAGR